MSTMIQIRNVPSDVHRQIKARAALAGMTLSDYLLQEVRKLLERPSRDEFLQSVRELSDVALDPAPAEVIRSERDER